MASLAVRCVSLLSSFEGGGGVCFVDEEEVEEDLSLEPCGWRSLDLTVASLCGDGCPR